MKTSKIVSAALIAATLAGCAAKPREYQPDTSRALNLARAGGLYDISLRDSEDGTRSYSKGFLMPMLQLASLATSFDAPLRNLSGTQTFVFNAADIMATPDKPSARPTLLGWMPASMATTEDEAHQKYVMLVDQAIKQVSDDMGLAAKKLENVRTPKIEGYPLMLWSIESAQYGCTKGQCIVAYNIKKPYLWKAPSFVKGSEPTSYNLSGNNTRNYSRFIFRQSGEATGFPEDSFYRAISAELPPWIVMYYPPDSVSQDGESLPYPVLYENGQQLMFKEP